jgi:LysM repeat protein
VASPWRHFFLSFATGSAGIIDPMTDRGVPATDGSSACPFVAFEDDRDERADRPDHRHRCFAEAVPAPRALAHQEAYCLSSAFPVCPTFQEWARREAAHAQPGRAGATDADEAGAEVAAAAAGDDDQDADDLWSTAREVPIEERPRRNPPRDWAAPPPWAGGAPPVGAGAVAASGRLREDAGDDAVPEEGRGLAGSAADRLARGEDPDHAFIGAVPPPRDSDVAPVGPAAPPDPELAGLVGRRPGIRSGPGGVDDEALPPVRAQRRPTVSSTRDRSRERERERERERAAEERAQHDGPSWERQRRYEAYPSIKLRAGLTRVPQLPRITVLFGALLIAALLLFLLPSVLNIGGRVQAPGASASASDAVASPSAEPTPVPVATPQIYTIKSGDALARIARRFGLTLEQLRAANPEIKDPNKIRVGDKIVIPTPPPPDEVTASEAPSASPS